MQAVEVAAPRGNERRRARLALREQTRRHCWMLGPGHHTVAHDQRRPGSVVLGGVQPSWADCEGGYLNLCRASRLDRRRPFPVTFRRFPGRGSGRSDHRCDEGPLASVVGAKRKVTARLPPAQRNFGASRDRLNPIERRCSQPSSPLPNGRARRSDGAAPAQGRSAPDVTRGHWSSKPLKRAADVAIDQRDASVERRIDAWSAYWRTGRRTSCTDGPGVERLVPLWHDFFDRLGAGARILDLATGAGCVAHIAQATARARGVRFDIVGVDAADLATREGARADEDGPLLTGGVRLEVLPFPDESFDAATSQFGLEYADEPRAVRELARVLRRGADLRMVLHARGGAIFQSIAERVARLRPLIAKRGLVGALMTAARCSATGETDTTLLAEISVEAAAKVARDLREAPPLEDAAFFYADGLMRMWANRERYEPGALFSSVADAHARIEALLLRQEALLDAAHSGESAEVLRAILARAGIQTGAATAVRDDTGAQIAWLIDGRRQEG